MFHVKQLRAKLKLYKALLRDYHSALDLMSQAAIDTLDVKVEESLKYTKFINTNANTSLTIVDVGSGAGLPAVPIALALPHCQIHMVERRTKRTTFLKIVKTKLELSNLHVHALDVTDFKGVKADIVSALAFSSLTNLYCLTRHLQRRDVLVLSRKGPDWQREIDELRNTVSDFGTIEASSTALSNDGTLVALRLPGGLACQSSA